MAESEGRSAETIGEGRVEGESSPEIRDELFRAYEQSIAEEYNRENPPLPEGDRVFEELKNSDGKVIGVYCKIREPQKYTYKDREETWVLFDFDDVLSLTTDADNERGRRLGERIGISATEYRTLYDAAKVKNDLGKSILRPELLISSIIKHYPNHEADIRDVFAHYDQQQFMNQGVVRTIEALRHTNRMMRMSILSLGDFAYQRAKIESSGILQYMDDVIYTEGSKREVLERLVAEQYPPRTHVDPHSKREVETPLPNIITVDDSPEHIDDYTNLPLENYANIRFQHPSAKRYGKPHKAEDAAVARETSGNEAALALYQMIAIGGSDSTKEKVRWWSSDPATRQEIHELLRDPEKAWSVLHLTQSSYPDEDVAYHREGDSIVREWTNYPTPHSWGIDVSDDPRPLQQQGRRLVTSSGHSFAQRKSDHFQVDQAIGTIADFRFKHFDPEEFILSAPEKRKM